MAAPTGRRKRPWRLPLSVLLLLLPLLGRAAAAAVATEQQQQQSQDDDGHGVPAPVIEEQLEEEFDGGRAADSAFWDQTGVEVGPHGETRDLKNIEYVLSDAVGQHLLGKYWHYTEASSTTATNREPWFPGCPVFDAINKDPTDGCNFIRFHKDLLTALWVDFSRTSSMTTPKNPDGSLPRRLKDHRPNPPRRVDQATILAERPTYYFCYRLILLLYAITFDYDEARMQMELPQLLPDWGHQRWYHVKYLKPRRLRLPNAPKRLSPIATSMMRGEEMVVVIRGTIWREEWCKDFMYRWAKDDAHLFPGRTHEGMYSVFVDFYQELEAEVMAKRPTYIFVTGHSLGAGLANMVGLRLQKSLDYTPGVDVVSFGGPNTGDEEFAEAFRQGVNSRHIIFLGHGAEPDPAKYTAGDICAQYTCESYPGCDILDTGPNGAWYHYVRPHNQVPFFPEELPNAQTWRDVANIKRLPPSPAGVLASHVCSYMCWTSQGMGDLDSKCYFSREPGRPDLPKEYYCDWSQVPL